MESKIEDIWKKGFLKEDALVAPRVNDLYNRKSLDLIDRIKRLFKINLLMLYFFAAAILAYSVLMGFPIWLAIILPLLFIVPAIYSQIQVRRHSQPMRKYSNSYEYLQQFDQWLKGKLKRNTLLARYYYPITILATSCMIWFAKGREAIMEKLLESNPDMPLIGGIPLYFALPVLILVLLTAIFGDKIYHWDVRIMYGKVLDKLDELIADLEELRN